ncbi:MAG TPA: SCO family protein [Candidatus Limnocylindrales bacterium]|nr:SCO family protein [Candidatus Limnocylindrales bacterium]
MRAGTVFPLVLAAALSLAPLAVAGRVEGAPALEAGTSDEQTPPLEAGGPGEEPLPLKAGTFSPARMAPDFRLRGSDGQELTLERFRGKVVVIFFGFTNCPAVCPTTLSTLARARKQLGADAEQVQIVYVTVDPERDTEARMREYLGGFDATFVGGTGSEDQLAAVRRDFGISATRENVGASYMYSHSASTHLIDPAGRLVALMPYGQSAEDYVHDLRILLRK